jgi:hypothetical protein
MLCDIFLDLILVLRLFCFNFAFILLICFWLCDTQLADVFVIIYRCHDFTKMFGPRIVMICDQVLLYVNYRLLSLNCQLL